LGPTPSDVIQNLGRVLGRLRILLKGTQKPVNSKDEFPGH